MPYIPLMDNGRWKYVITSTSTKALITNFFSASVNFFVEPATLAGFDEATAQLTALLRKVLDSPGQHVYQQSAPRIADQPEDGFRMWRMVWLGDTMLVDATAFWFYDAADPQRSVNFAFFDTAHRDFKFYAPILSGLEWPDGE